MREKIKAQLKRFVVWFVNNRIDNYPGLVCSTFLIGIAIIYMVIEVAMFPVVDTMMKTSPPPEPSVYGLMVFAQPGVEWFLAVIGLVSMLFWGISSLRKATGPVNTLANLQLLRRISNVEHPEDAHEAMRKAVSRYIALEEIDPMMVHGWQKPKHQREKQGVSG